MGAGPDIHFALKVMVDPKAGRQAPPPYFIDGAAFATGIPLNNWQGLKDLRGDLGIFVDFSGVSAGLYDFGLDLVLTSGAEQPPTQVFEPQSFSWIAAPSDN
jgi:hypothetical protein